MNGNDPCTILRITAPPAATYPYGRIQETLCRELGLKPMAMCHPSNRIGRSMGRGRYAPGAHARGSCRSPLVGE